MTRDTLAWTLTAMLPAAYLLGGIPFGLLVGRLRGIDVRASGSGNIGATNAGRALGRRYFYLVLLLDALKAAVPAGIASALVLTQITPEQRSPLIYPLWLGTGVAAVLGHVFSPFLGLRGGKGVATALGIVLGVWPYMTLPGLVALLVFVVVFRITKYISAGSLAAAAVFPAAYLGIALLRGWDPLGRQWPLLALATLVAGLIILRHRSNVRRLIAGTEIRNA